MTMHENFRAAAVSVILFKQSSIKTVIWKRKYFRSVIFLYIIYICLILIDEGELKKLNGACFISYLFVLTKVMIITNYYSSKCKIPKRESGLGLKHVVKWKFKLKIRMQVLNVWVDIFETSLTTNFT